MDFQNNPYHQHPESDREQTTGYGPDNKPEQTPEYVPDTFQNQAPGNYQGQAPANMPGNPPYQAPGHSPGNYPYQIPGHEQNQMPSVFPDKMPGYRPVTVRSMPQTENGLSSASMTLGIIGAVSTLFFFFLPFVPFILMSISIVLALLSKGSGRQFSPHAKTGLITSTVCLSIIVLLFTALVFFFASADLINEAGGPFGGDSYEDIYDDFYEFYY